ncbi:deoxyguanosinetriphosphate triphosphohydrolase [Streptomyces bacillaris]|uniref:deoxyguanosinetriphosphate triphosphohydrolase n=1 Tax=Streptomyces bacillaris TaxID=68179 RepID=UPI003827512B
MDGTQGVRGAEQTHGTEGARSTQSGTGPVPYGPADTERFDTEPDKRPGRTAFQRDRARVLHSAALRRLAGKTQVVTPGTRSHAWDASPRTRLTHSLECAQVGRELGAVLGCDPDLVETACLSHDMGHPPFGHNGEQALNDFASDCGGFEGNAQSLRLLTRLEPKRFIHDPRTGELVSVGLNLTRAALDAATKYPWPRGAHPTDPHSVKFGVYADDLPVFEWARKGAPEDRTCFEAQVMDWSDDVAYSVHDFEDGLHAGHIDPNCLYAEPEREEIFAVAIGRYVPADTDPQELAEALDRLIDQEWWPHGYDGSAVAQARLKDATSQLIGRFCTEAETATRAVHGPGRLTRYGAELVVPRTVRNECAVLKAVADRYVMQRAEQETLRADQRIVIAELAAALTARAPEGLEPHFRALFDQAIDDHARKRVLVDQIAALTDASARSLHAALTERRG